MADRSTHHFLELYKERLHAPMAFSKEFATTRRSFFSSEDVEFDTLRGDQKIAGVVSSIDSTGNKNTNNTYTNKRVTPPVFREEVVLRSGDLIKRLAGRDPYQDVNFQMSIMEMVMDSMELLHAKVARAIEWQSAQILQTGDVTLQDNNGANAFTITYSPKAAHFPTAGTSWASATSLQKLTDLDTLADNIRKNGKVRPNKLYMGNKVFQNLILDAGIQALYDNRTIDVGSISKGMEDEDGKILQGVYKLGRFDYAIYTYDGFGTTPAGVDIDFLDDGNIVMLSSQSNLQAAYGNIPHIGRALGQKQLIRSLPSRVSSSAFGIDMHPHVWLSENGRELYAEISSRPLMVPKGIDTFGCLITQL